jgi:hypothetical protein
LLHWGNRTTRRYSRRKATNHLPTVQKCRLELASASNPAYRADGVVSFSYDPRNNEASMRKLSITVAAAALALTSLTWTAGAQTQQAGASTIQTLVRNATPFKQTGCYGIRDRCPFGTFRVCGPFRCWCRPC